MAPNYNQSQAAEDLPQPHHQNGIPVIDNDPIVDNASERQNHHNHHQQQPEVQSQKRTERQQFESSRASDNGSRLRQCQAIASRKVINDAHLITSRRIHSNQKARVGLELMCEDKVSKYKLEEVHCSLPSSVKSTFIMTFSPDGQRVASTHGDHRIYICDLNTGRLLDTLEGHPKTPWCLAWHPINREILASGCLAGEVRVWDLRSKACESWTSENNTIITSLDFHPKERVLVIATANDIHFWDWSESVPFAKTTTIHDKEKVKFVEFDSSGTKLITGISNLPKFAGCGSSDSLQNRIIDSYLTQGNLDQLPTENMTQNSEITSPLSGTLNSNELFQEQRNAPVMTHARQLISGLNNNEQDISYRSTLTLSRVAFLYRQLEALEDSMRHTSFPPYIVPRPVVSPVTPIERNSNGLERIQQSDSPLDSQSSATIINENEFNSETPPMQHTPSQGNIDQTPQQASDSQSIRSVRAPNPFEPFVVSFDESLEHLQLSPLIVDRQVINLATIIEQYPIDLPVHYVMHYESINQVNQNFIRISKLMSSVRLYRQIVQQIISSNSGQVQYLPNQILIAQSASQRSSRHVSNLPLVFRNSSTGGQTEPNLQRVGTRSTDPVLAIQFRNSARNVPLATICKIDLLSARSACIMRSQLLIERTISGGTRAGQNNDPQQQQQQQFNVPDNAVSNNSAKDREANQASSSSNDRELDNNIDAHPSFYLIIYQLYESLTVINHEPLTTSNVYAHITSLRSLLNKLLTTLSSMFQTQEEGSRIISLIHDVAHSLTGRRWNVPLGATLDDIRLDVIHTLCIVDLALHLTRQVQLLQMQRLSAVARIEEYRRISSRNRADDQSAATSNSAFNCAVQGSSSTSAEFPIEPSTSRDSSNPSLCKRKDIGSSLNIDDDNLKRIKVDVEGAGIQESNSNVEMIDVAKQSTSSADAQPTSSASVVHDINPSSSTSSSMSYVQNPNNMHNTSPESVPADRLVLWSRTPSQVEQSLQRFLVATASSMSNSHILVRIYHRLHGGPGVSANNFLTDNSVDRSLNLPPESRRRALSQDNSASAGVVAGQQDNVIAVGSPSADQATRNRFLLNYASPHLPHLHVYQTRGTGHLWFNQWTIPLPSGNANYRLQCWNFSVTAIPNIKDSQTNIVTQKCRIHNDASIDISSDGSLVACLVPRDEGPAVASFNLKIFSLRSFDFGTCHYQLAHGPNAISVSLSPSASYAVVGLASNKFLSNDPTDDDLTIAKVFKLSGKNSVGYVRDIKIKRDDSALSLNAIRWMPRGIVYNVGPQHHQRYQAARVRNRVV